MLTVVSEPSDIERAQRSLEESVSKLAKQVGPVTLSSFQGGSGEVHCTYHDGFWVGFGDEGNRWWNAMGFGNPFEGPVSITVELNPPKSGINRQVSGLLASAPGSPLPAAATRVRGET